MKKLSIIIPHYDDISGLRRLLHSIGKHSNIEVIVIDDNTPNLKALPDDIGDNVDLFLRNNTGQKSAGAARNLGLKSSTGKWVLFADSDDFFLDGYYGKIATHIDTHDEKLEVVYFKPSSQNLATGDVGTRHKVYCDLIDRFNKLDSDDLRYDFHVPWSKLIKKSFLVDNKITFDEVSASNDVMFSLKVGVHAKNILALDESIYIVSEREGSLVTKKCKRNKKSRFDVQLDRNSYLFNIGMKHKQCSLISFLYNYYNVLQFPDIKKLFENVVKGKQRLI